MAITQGTCNTFRSEVLQALHNFTTTTGDVFKIALYTSSATIGPDTTVYTTFGETSGGGYTAGGIALTNVTPTLSGTTGITTFADPTFSSVSISFRGALIYNSSKANRAVCVLDFGADQTVSSGNFTVQFPVATNTTAIIRIG